MCSDALIGAKIKTIFDDEHGLYGAKRIAASLNDDTDFGPINHKKVARIMNSMGLKGFTKRRRCEVPRILFLGICLDFYYFLRRVLLPKFGFHFDWGSVSQALVKSRLVPP
ncbi:transposase [Corynebacterium sp. HMSC072D12]|uniref:transposase n=1 Tax=Corynebacterium sp. HMSC072D12 TaxID=1739447 RepID=UPI001FEE6C20|nr:transposase [Corynebacterium sp. HMSC072D12]